MKYLKKFNESKINIKDLISDVLCDLGPNSSSGFRYHIWDRTNLKAYNTGGSRETIEVYIDSSGRVDDDYDDDVNVEDVSSYTFRLSDVGDDIDQLLSQVSDDYWYRIEMSYNFDLDFEPDFRTLKESEYTRVKNNYRDREIIDGISILLSLK
jgi:hypothetical protein